MSRTKQIDIQRAILAALGGWLLALLLLFVSPGRDSTLRSLVADLLNPGQQVTLSGARQLQTLLQSHLFKNPEDPGNGAQISNRQQQQHELQTELRQALLKQSQLQQRLADARLVPFRGQPGLPIVLPELLEARILGIQRDAWQKSGLMLDGGLLAGLPESAFVIDRPQQLIDQGADARLQRGQPVYMARSVIGKISHVGRWTSTVQLVTDRDYRGRARTARRTKAGYLFGVESILEGTGSDLCRLKFIPSTEAVRVGDEVFTADENSLLRLPMYYGRIVKAELKPTAPHWDVWVEPAISEMKLEQVSVLRTQFQRERYLAN